MTPTPSPAALIYPDLAYRPDPVNEAANAKRVREAEIAGLRAERDQLLQRRHSVVREI
jgi:hypothetical protein